MLALCLAVCSLELGLSWTARAATITSFDVPGALYTYAQSINAVGGITGYYQDFQATNHGFLRAPDGTFATFDAPGAGTNYTRIGTFGQSINLAGAIAGYYGGPAPFYLIHGFLRTPDGTLTTFDAPGAGTSSFFQGTYAVSINQAGAITGFYQDASTVEHGFLRAPDGTFTTFDAPGGVLGTAGACINQVGAITGRYFDANSVVHGFLRAPDGTFTTFDVPTAGTSPGEGTYPVSINAAGVITGNYYYGRYFESRGFVRNALGHLTLFIDPKAGGAFLGTYPASINPAGGVAITGFYRSTDGGWHGFLRASDGTFTNFDPPGSNNNGGSTYTIPRSINSSGVITGFYTDTTSLHGFIRSP